MINLPSGNEEISLLKFIGKYQYLNIEDAKYFFNSTEYYRKRIRNLLSNKYIRKRNTDYVLATNGIQYIKSLNSTYNRLNPNRKYYPRLTYISRLAAFYINCSNVNFIPSFDLKNDDCYTITSRRYIGLFKINGTTYLAYRIPKTADKRYISSVIYDIQKEKNYRNFILFVDDISLINTLDFTFGYNQFLIIEDNLQNREKLKYLNNVNWPLIIQNEYKNTYLSEHIYCDYEDIKNNCILYFYLFDTEKINRINQHLKLNKDKQAYVVCDKSLKPILQHNIIKAKFNVINLEKYTCEKRNIYYE